ncbi:GGDEF domain-containing protein [Neosynechococcus sphagnicola]|uniref:GGDEF domain-containing protein n=1 Tax=Neosynechococcus sphagnicola TaxID=1501145 RepID=UPI00068ECD39|nr:GGDEF domain-containing protein [Neosynechococcus sphagnicola]
MEICNHDLLTGLPSLHLIPECIEQLTHEHDQLGLLLLDIDRFILFNVYYGHQAGDEKLKQIANLICQSVPKNAKVFRSGGDEFAVVLGGRPMAEVVSVAMQVWNTINLQLSSLPLLERCYFFLDKSYLKIPAPLTVSCGVIFYPAHGMNFAVLREVAEKAMYRGGKSLNPRGVLVVAELEG